MEGKRYPTPDASGALHRRFCFVIIEADDPAQTIIGTVGVNALAPAPPVGYGLVPEHWGKGYASEALRGVLDAWWGLPRIMPDHEQGSGPEVIYSCCNKDNVGSARVLEKNGFECYDEVLMEVGHTVAFYRLERPF